MPGYRGHLMGGTAVYLVILHCIQSYNPSFSYALQGLFFCLIGALFPDVDIKSKGQKLFYIFVLAALVVFLWYNRLDLFIALSLLSVVPLLVRHRGIFHKVWFLIFLSISTALMIGSYHSDYSSWAMHNALFFLAGALSHVFFDRMLTQIKVWWYRSKR